MGKIREKNHHTAELIFESFIPQNEQSTFIVVYPQWSFYHFEIRVGFRNFHLPKLKQLLYESKDRCVSGLYDAH